MQNVEIMPIYSTECVEYFDRKRHQMLVLGALMMVEQGMRMKIITANFVENLV